MPTHGRPRTAAPQRLPHARGSTARTPGRPQTGGSLRSPPIHRAPGSRPGTASLKKGQHWGSPTAPMVRSQVDSFNKPELDHRLGLRDEQIRENWLEEFVSSQIKDGASQDLHAEWQQCSLAFQKVRHSLSADNAVYGGILQKVMVRFDRVVTELFSVQQKGQTSYKLQNRRMGELEQQNAQLMRRSEEMVAELQKSKQHEAGPVESADPAQSIANKFRVGGLRARIKQGDVANQKMRDNIDEITRSKLESEQDHQKAIDQFDQMEGWLTSAEQDICEQEQIEKNMGVMIKILPHLMHTPEPDKPRQVSIGIQVEVDNGMDSELQALKNMMNAMSAKNSALKGECDRLKEIEPPPEIDTSNLEQTVKQLTHQIQSLEFLNHQTQAELRQARSMMESMEQMIDDMKKKIAELMLMGDETSAKLRDQLAAMEQERNEMRERIKQLLLDLEQANNRYNDFHNLADLDGDKSLSVVAELNRQIKELRQEIADMLAGRQTLLERIQELERGNASRAGREQKELQELRDLFKRLQQENAELQKRLEGMTALQVEVERLRELLNEKPVGTVTKKKFKNTTSQTDAQITPRAQSTQRESNATQGPQTLSLLQEAAGSDESYSTNINSRSLGDVVHKDRMVVDFRHAPEHNGRCLTPKVLTRLIIQFYLDKMAADVVDDNQGNGRATLAEFCFDQLINKYGLRKLANKHIMELIGSVKKYKEISPRILIFGRLLGLLRPYPSGEAACNFMLGVISLLRDCQGDFHIATDGRCVVSLPIAVAVMPSIFKLAKQDQLEATLREILANAIWKDNTSDLETAEIDLDDYLEVIMVKWESDNSKLVTFLNTTYSEIRGDRTGVHNLEQFRDAFEKVGLQCARNAKITLGAYSKCSRFDAGDKDDDAETISQEAFVSVAFQMLLEQEESGWRVSIAEKLTQKMFESRTGLTTYWRTMDTDGNGTVDIAEFRKGVRDICPEITHGEVNELIRMVTPDSKRGIPYMEFIRRFQPVFAATLRHRLGADWDERIVQRVCDAVYAQHTALKHSFKLFDSSGDGLVSIEEFSVALNKLGIEEVDNDACAAMVMLMDSNGDGQVCYNEFLRAFTIVDTNKTTVKDLLH